MSTRYIFNPDNFDGTCLTTIDTNTGKIAYTQLNWDEYNAAHGGNLQALEWDDFYHNWIKPHELKLQGEWIECAEADYDEMLNILPPLKYREINGFETFFVGEATTGTLFQMYACKNGKYWTALRDATRSPDDLGKELLELVKVDLSIERLAVCDSNRDAA